MVPLPEPPYERANPNGQARELVHDDLRSDDLICAAK
jgi:hypothetical protein